MSPYINVPDFRYRRYVRWNFVVWHHRSYCKQTSIVKWSMDAVCLLNQPLENHSWQTIRPREQLDIDLQLDLTSAWRLLGSLAKYGDILYHWLYRLLNCTLITDAFREKLKTLDIISLFHPYLAHQGHLWFADSLIDIIRQLAEYGEHFHIFQALMYLCVYRGI